MDPDVLTIGHIKSSLSDEKFYKIIVEITHTGKEVCDICISYHAPFSIVKITVPRNTQFEDISTRTI